MGIQDYIIADFSRRYDALMKEKQYPPLYIMATGGGMGVSDLLVYPGSSSRIASIIHPYSMDMLWELAGPEVRKGPLDFTAKKEDWRSVHPESALIYLQSIKHSVLQDYYFVAATAALETTRRRKGKNVCYVATQPGRYGPKRVWEILLRKHEDDPSYFYSRNENGETVTRVSTPDEEWNSMFMRDGEINMGNLAMVRQVQDNNISRAILNIVLDDPTFYAPLVDGESITLLSEDDKDMNKLWMGGKYDR